LHKLHCQCGVAELKDASVRGPDVKGVIMLDSKDVLPNINCSQAAERAENAVFVPGDFDLSPSPSNSSK